MSVLGKCPSYRGVREETVDCISIVIFSGFSLPIITKFGSLNVISYNMVLAEVLGTMQCH